MPSVVRRSCMVFLRAQRIRLAQEHCSVRWRERHRDARHLLTDFRQPRGRRRGKFPVVLGRVIVRVIVSF